MHLRGKIVRRTSVMKAQEQFRRKTVVLNSSRQRELDRDECMAKVIESMAGTTHEELAQRMDGPVSVHRVRKGDRTYTVDVTIVEDETPGVIRVVFSVDDGGLWITAPKTASRFVSPNEYLSP
jgi:hypothetical protein